MNESTQTGKSTRERIPPHSTDAEQAVLGAMLISQEAVGVAVEILRDSRRFYSTGHRVIFDVIIGLFDKNKPADLTTVADELEKRGQLGEAGGRSYLADLAGGVATAANIFSILNSPIRGDLISSSPQEVSIRAVTPSSELFQFFALTLACSFIAKVMIFLVRLEINCWP